MADPIVPNVVVSMPAQNFTLARSFKAAAAGKVYIGLIDTDPTIPENQIQVYLQNEDGSVVPVSQPIIINAGGYPVYNGQIAKFVTVQGHSMAVYDALNVQQFYFPNVLKYDPDQLRQELTSFGGDKIVGSSFGGTVFSDYHPSMYRKSGEFGTGVEMKTARDAVLYNDGFYYAYSGDLPHLSVEVSLNENYFCVGLLDGWPVNTPQNFGAKGDGIADDTIPVQRLFDYCAPFIWKGSIADTKSALSAARDIATGVGMFRTTDTLLINPFMRLYSPSRGAFFMGLGGFHIIADFDSRNGYVIDSAPYTTSGSRIKSLVTSGGAFDSGLITGCLGWELDGICVTVKGDRLIKGCVNRNASMQSIIRNSGFIGANVGIRTSVTWGGGLYDNHVVANAYCLLNEIDVTVDNQFNNYLTIDKDKKPTASDFDYPSFGDYEPQGMTACIYNSYARPNHHNNIWEGAEIGAMNINESNAYYLNNYSEGIRKYVYAVHTCDIDIKLSVVFCAGSDLIWATGGDLNKIKIDFSSVANFTSLSGWGVSSYIPKIIITGSKVACRFLPFWDKVDYIDVATSGKRIIYLSNSGDDANNGFLSIKPVKTLQEAIDRCGTDDNVIVISGAVDTKYVYSSGGNATTKIVDIMNLSIDGGEITVKNTLGEIESLPQGIKNLSINGVKINLPDNVSEYRQFIPVLGQMNISITGGSVNWGTLMGPKFGKTGIAILTATDTKLACNLVYTPGSGSFSWIDGAYNVDKTGGSIGAGSPASKISSQLYP